MVYEHFLQDLSRSYKAHQYQHGDSDGIGIDNQNNTDDDQRSVRKKRIEKDADDSTCHSSPSNNVPGPASSSPSCCCFEVLPCPNSRGVGMFATVDIPCGSLIVSSEAPFVCTAGVVVSSLSETSTSAALLFCNVCACPLGTLQHHIHTFGVALECNEGFFENARRFMSGGGNNSGGNNSDNRGENNSTKFSKHLNFQEKEGEGNDEKVVTCERCHNVAWCSQKCKQVGTTRHRFLCHNANDSDEQPQDDEQKQKQKQESSEKDVNNEGKSKRQKITNKQHRTKPSLSLSSSLQDFYGTIENPNIFRLAINSITLILAYIIDHWETLSNKDASMMNDHDTTFMKPSLFHFWKDYGSHPLWWDVGNSENRMYRKRTTERFLEFLNKHLELLPQEHIYESSLSSFLRCIIDDVCTMEHMGQILGMFQCNVMEYEFISPIQQYIDHCIMIEEEEEQEENDAYDDDLTSEEQKRVESWKEDPQSDTMKAVTGIHSDRKEIFFEATKGSGLYPLLTLANHNCDPNASIDFLTESNRGSMVALRHIPKGEEICITYVPNGDFGAATATNPERFRHHQPSRTWRFLNAHTHQGQSDDEDEDEKQSIETDIQRQSPIADEDNSHMSDSYSSRSSDKSSSSSSSSIVICNESLCSEGLGAPEGHSAKERSIALNEYGFECGCQRCLQELNTQ